MTIEQLVTDEAVELVFTGAYIGAETKRGVIPETLQKLFSTTY